jgi:hypothetical protein
MIEKFDKKEVYCRQLGHHVAFKYCRLVNNNLPCHQVFNCWFEIFPVQEFVSESYTKEEIATIVAPPPGRLEGILSIAEKFYNEQQKD